MNTTETTKQTKRGGKRSNAGRKPLPYKMKQLTIRVPEVHHEELTRIVKSYIASNPAI